MGRRALTLACASVREYTLRVSDLPWTSVPEPRRTLEVTCDRCGTEWSVDLEHAEPKHVPPDRGAVVRKVSSPCPTCGKVLDLTFLSGTDTL
jgi:endogenous inhibitor of DNA gyrase (YacG/DUF329 family)